MYDGNNNLSQIARYSVVVDVSILCEVLSYKEYDNKINPAYSDDEVRILISSESFLNTAKNNVISASEKYLKSHTYRNDGRPLSCKVFDGGTTEGYRLDYYYK